MIGIGNSIWGAALRGAGGSTPSSGPVRTLLLESFDATGSSSAVAAAAGDLLVAVVIGINDVSVDMGLIPNATWGSQVFARAVHEQFNDGNNCTTILTLLVSAENAGSHAVAMDWGEGDSPSGAVGSIESWSSIASAVPDVTASAQGTAADPSSGYTDATSQAREIVLCAVGWSGVPWVRGTWESGLTAGVDIETSLSGDALSTAYRVLTEQAAVRARKTGASEELWGAVCAAFRVAA